ncbi:helix-turn-helix domain-containing protein [Streptomyces noursei]|uniref:helix-turn-helix domain-containing protein n=1 Tax=Streptomyces noursei TaxID=1971 RepID=UPI001676CAD5|nr:helix-turn-helix transcriptional regulator [Streptomyces noursei]MCZ1019803.1 helix-turn-helix transcriptional regulator [Streptomyces noursei]GGX36528.1 transcriptional regulator [Streptomyces noursei]
MPAARKARPEPSASVIRMQGSDEQRPASRLLGDELRFHRERLGYTLADAARVIRGSTSKVSRLERGESPAKPRDVHDLALFYDLSREQRSQLEQLLAQAGNADLYARFADVTPNFLKRLIRLERSAEKIFVFEPRVVPGLLQTEAYARAIVRVMEVGLPDSDIERIVALRMERQVMLDQDVPTLAALIGEEVLYRPYGSANVMAEQIRLLLKATLTSRVNIRIVRKQAEMPPYPIFHLTFADGDCQELAYVEHLDGANYVTQKRQLDKYRRLMDNVRANAYDRKDSTAALQRALRHWEQQAATEQSN